MSRLRSWLLCLLMAAVPLQGFAAVSMLFCGMGEHHGARTAQRLASAQPAHDHAAHAGHDVAGSHHAQETTEQPASPTAALPDAAHKCGVCSACCSSIAISASPQPRLFASLPQAALHTPFVRLQPRPAPVPDKPPRA